MSESSKRVRHKFRGSKAKRIRRLKLEQQKKSRCDLTDLKKEIKKAKKEKKAMKSTTITNFMKCCPNFAGCFPEDSLHNLVIQSFPCFIIVNTDSSDMPGSHWIALGIFKSRIEIFDSLGFQILNWPRIPCSMLNFLHKFSQTRRIVVSRRIQSDDSVLCGYFCIFYILFRHFSSLSYLLSFFDIVNNDDTLIKFF